MTDAVRSRRTGRISARHLLTVVLGTVWFPLLSGTPSWAHLGDTVFPIYELASDELPELEGGLSDWEGVLPNASLDHRYFVDVAGAATVDLEDSALRVFLAWHNATQRIYVAVEGFDDLHHHRDPRITFSVDGDHSGGQFLFFDDSLSEEERRRLSYAQAQAYTLRPDDNVGKLILATSPTLRWTAESPWAEFAGIVLGESPALFSGEFFVTPWDDLVYNDPESSVRSSLQPGQIIGFQLTVIDADPPDGVETWRSLTHSTLYATERSGSVTLTHDLFSGNFVDGQLIPCHRSDCSGRGTAVQPSTWARIKSGLQD